MVQLDFLKIEFASIINRLYNKIALQADTIPMLKNYCVLQSLCCSTNYCILISKWKEYSSREEKSAKSFTVNGNASSNRLGGISCIYLQQTTNEENLYHWRKFILLRFHNYYLMLLKQLLFQQCPQTTTLAKRFD